MYDDDDGGDDDKVKGHTTVFDRFLVEFLRKIDGL